VGSDDHLHHSHLRQNVPESSRPESPRGSSRSHGLLLYVPALLSPIVSVIIVNYRSYDDLIGCLVAVLSEHIGSLEVVVVDQQGDARAAIIRERFPETTLIPNPHNTGFAAGVNLGASRAAGRYFLVVNPDTVVSVGLIGALAAALDAHPDVAIVGPRIFNGDGTLQPSARRFPDVTTGLGGRMSWLTRVAPNNWLTRRNLDASRATEPVEVDWVSGACMMIRRSAFDAVGGMDERFFLYWEDADLCRRLRTAGYRTMYVPTVSAIHAGASGSRRAAVRSLVAFHRSAFRYYWKHGSLLARIFAPFVQLALWARLLLKLATLRRSVDSTPTEGQTRT
jgi:GT2 family glycosyltransferase